MKKKLPREDDACPHCGRPMERPVLERLSNPFCVQCLPERRQAALLLFSQPDPAEETGKARTLYG